MRTIRDTYEEILDKPAKEKSNFSDTQVLTAAVMAIAKELDWVRSELRSLAHTLEIR